MKTKTLIVGGVLWVGSVFTVNYLNVQRNKTAYFSDPVVYTSEQEFLDDLTVEKHKLGLDTIPITWEDDVEVDGGHTFRVRDEYLMKFNPARKSRRILRHELYHVKHWGESSFLDTMLWGQVEEWKATSYSLQPEKEK